MSPIKWLLEDDRGISSETILAVMVGETKANMIFDTPKDSGDFGRCYRMLQHFPEWEERLNEVSDIFSEWEPFFKEWSELKQLYEENKFDNLDTKIRKLVKEGK